MAALGVALAPKPVRAQQRSITELSGSLNRQTFAAFEKAVFDNMDQVIGLKVSAVPSEHASGFTVLVSQGQFVVYRVGGDTEIVANSGFTLRQGAYVFDGFFLVKNGGVHQGTVSAGLEFVPEAQVRLARGVTIRRVTLR